VTWRMSGDSSVGMLKVTLIVLGVIVGLVGLGFATYGIVTGIQSAQTAPFGSYQEVGPR